MSTREYRVTWQREGLPPRRKLYQRHDAAQAWIRRLTATSSTEAHPDLDPDDYACCSGYECACHGESNAQAWEWRYGSIPRLVVGPVLEERPVGEWSAA